VGIFDSFKVIHSDVPVSATDTKDHTKIFQNMNSMEMGRRNDSFY